MMKLRELFEEFGMYSKNIFGVAHPIFVNPDRGEMKELEKGQMVRYIIDYSKTKIYVFSSDLLHAKASHELGIPYSPNEFRGVTFGVGEVENGKIVFGDRMRRRLLGKKGTKEKKLISRRWLQRYIRMLK